MDHSELICNRRSVRTFDGKSIEPEVLQDILGYAQKAENPYNQVIEWKLLNTGEDGVSSAVIVGTDTFIAGKMMRAAHAEEAFGYSFEKIVLYAQSLGIGTTWIGGTMTRAAFEKAVQLGENEVMPCVSPLGYPAEKMSVRETMMRAGIKADTRFGFAELFFDGSFDKPLAPENAGRIKQALELVQRSPSAVNRQPWRIVVDDNKVHFYEKRSKGYVDKTGWDMQKIDIGIAMCHFVCGLEEQNITPAFTVNDPGIAHGSDTEYITTYTI